MNTLTISLVFLLFAAVLVHGEKVSANIWKGYEKIHEEFEFPELGLPDVTSKRNVAVCFEGGGTRSFSATIGILAALLELGLMDEIRYLTGVSGGALGVLSYSFYNNTPVSQKQRDLHPTIPFTDEDFLGNFIPPQNLTREYLSVPCSRCALRVTSIDLWRNLLIGLTQMNVTTQDIWTYAIAVQFLKPFGIHPRALMTHSEDTKDDILRRNPFLASYEPGFVTQHANRPFAIAGAMLLGPTELQPLSIRYHAFTKLGITPLYVGNAWNLNVTYKKGGLLEASEGSVAALGLTSLPPSEEEQQKERDRIIEGIKKLEEKNRNYNINSNNEQINGDGILTAEDIDSSPQTRKEKNSNNESGVREKTALIGGLIENFAFGIGAPSVSPIPPLSENGKRSVQFLSDSDHPFFTIRNAASVTSYACGALTSEITGISRLIHDVKDYWAPATYPTSQSSPPLDSEPYFLGDGGLGENIHAISMVKRGVRNLILVWNSGTPLKPREQFDPFQREPKGDDMEHDITNYFGIELPGDSSILIDTTRSQMFNKSDFPAVVDKMQQAQALGRGIVVTTELKTVENLWFGLEADITLNVTWIYLTRAREFEKLLPTAVQDLIRPEASPNDPSSIRKKGPLSFFPNYKTVEQFVLSNERATLLAHLTHWVAMEHKEVLLNAVRGF